MSETKKLCTKCKEYKDVTLFCKNNREKDKLNGWCKRCSSINRKVWYRKVGRYIDIDIESKERKRSAIRAVEILGEQDDECVDVAAELRGY